MCLVIVTDYRTLSVTEEETEFSSSDLVKHIKGYPKGCKISLALILCQVIVFLLPMAAVHNICKQDSVIFVAPTPVLTITN